MLNNGAGRRFSSSELLCISVAVQYFPNSTMYYNSVYLPLCGLFAFQENGPPTDTAERTLGSAVYLVAPVTEEIYVLVADLIIGLSWRVWRIETLNIVE